MRERGDGCWLDEMGGGCSAFAEQHISEKSGVDRNEKEWILKRGLRGDTPIPPYPISRCCDGADDLMIRGQPINSELARWGEVELCVCDPHSLLLHYLCQMDYHAQLCSCVRGWVCMCVWVCVVWLCPRPVNWDKWLCHWNIHCVTMPHP